GASGAERAAASAVVRVIGEPRVEKGRVRLPVCGPAGLRFLQALKRERPLHDALAAVERGSVLAVDDDEAARKHDLLSLSRPPVVLRADEDDGVAAGLAWP